MVTGSTSFDFDDDSYKIKSFIKRYKENEILKYIDTEILENYLRGEKLKKLKNGK